MNGESDGARPRPAPRPRTLSLGLSSETLAALPAHVLAPGTPVWQLAMAALDSVEFDALDAPELVISPLAEAPLDAVEIATRLQAAGFRGRYVAVGRGLKDVSLIQRDISRAAPSVSFAVVALDGGSALYEV